MILVDFGDAMVETKQTAPGTRPDSIFHFGIKLGSPKEDVEMARLMLAGESRTTPGQASGSYV